MAATFPEQQLFKLEREAAPFLGTASQPSLLLYFAF